MIHNYHYPLYAILSNIVDFSDKKILDFGCNNGLLLDTAKDKIAHENYTGMDICVDALEFAKNKYPGAKWIHYDGFNQEYNPNGDKNLLPIISEYYDLIIAHSVFTHTTVDEMTILIEHLSKHTDKFVFSWTSHGSHFTPEYVNDFSSNESYYYATNEENTACWVYYSPEYMSKLLEKYNHETFLFPDKPWLQNITIVTGLRD